ncbi:MAG TPA: hypothetical protein VG963_25135, partial [Polyangiaceae bacterium]|nr:hypothetical protein [Polyangiaceae bacterium]
MPQSDPISERLDDLHDHWVSFADNPVARLLIWRVADGEYAMVNAFVARESEPALARTPDLFVELAAPFRSETAYGAALASELCAQYSEASQGVEADSERLWQAPKPRLPAHDVGNFVRLCTSFRAHHLGDHDEGKLVLWLNPTHVNSNAEYMRWLQRLVNEAPSELRVLVLDSTSAPELAPLAKVERERVVERTCALDMSS